LAGPSPAGPGEPVALIGNAHAAAALHRAVAGTAGIAAVTPPVTRGGLAYLQATLATKPDSQAAYATVDRVRAAVQRIPGADAKVGGGTAITMDVERYATRDRNVIIPLVLLVVLIILGLLLRAGGADRHRDPVVRCRARPVCTGVPSPVRLRGRGHVGAAVHLRVPGGPGD